jgi:hypothetical protein
MAHTMRVRPVLPWDVSEQKCKSNTVSTIGQIETKAKRHLLCCKTDTPSAVSFMFCYYIRVGAIET